MKVIEHHNPTISDYTIQGWLKTVCHFLGAKGKLILLFTIK